MEIRSYTVGFAEGWRGAYGVLDRKVREDLETNVNIISVKDSLRRKADLTFSAGNESDDRMVRVVVFGRNSEKRD